MLQIPHEIWRWYGDNMIIAQLRSTCRSLQSLELCPARIEYNSDGSILCAGRYGIGGGKIYENDKVIARGTTGLDPAIAESDAKCLIGDPWAAWDIPAKMYQYIRTAIYTGTIPRANTYTVKFVGKRGVRLEIHRIISPGPFKYIGWTWDVCGWRLYVFNCNIPPNDPTWAEMGEFWYLDPK